MAKPKWLGKETPTRKRSDKQETRLAKTFGGRKTSNSGARFGENDVVSKQFDIEAKTTKKKQFTLKLSDLKQMERKTAGGKISAYVINFEESNDEYILLSMADFEDLGVIKH